ncbi:MAG: serine/threonine-protein kinase [Gemmataceae bacterium]
MDATTADRDTLLALLRQSGLVPDEALAAVRARHPSHASARAVAKALVADGTLTRFQAERLLAGRAGGFQIGPYRVLDQLGRGGMGRVYKAEHRTLGRLVALKVLAPEMLRTQRAVQLFLHEVRAVGQLVHPHVVTAFDAGEAGGRYYLVLEFVDGPNLDQLVRRQGPLAPGLACDYVRQAALGLQSAHLRGMVHRDIKPANLLVQRRGHDGDGSPGMVKVSDFGLARLATPGPDDRPYDSAGTIETRPNSVMGTPDYLSPEQSRSLHDTDIRTDIYSLGCTFYFLLTGSVPHPGGSAVQKLIRHSTERPEAVTAFRSDVPPPVLAVLQRMTAKRPDDRYRTPAEVAEALRPFAVSMPTPWVPPRPGSGSVIPAVGADEDLAALSPTVSSEADETLLPGRPARRHDREAAERVKLALVAAVCLVAGLVAAAALLAALGH